MLQKLKYRKSRIWVAFVYCCFMLQYAAAQSEAEPSYRDQMEAIQESKPNGPGGPCSLGFLSGVECTSNICRGEFCCEEQVAVGCRKCNNEGKCAECAVGFNLVQGSCSLVNTQFIGDPQENPTSSPVAAEGTTAPTTSVTVGTSVPSVSPIPGEEAVTQTPTIGSTTMPSASPTSAQPAGNTSTSVPSITATTSSPSSSGPEEPTTAPSQQPSLEPEEPTAAPSLEPTVINMTTERPNSPNTLPNDEAEPLPIPTVAVLTVALFAVAGLAIGVAFWRAPRAKPKSVDGT